MAGKAKSRRNATTHGILRRKILRLPGGQFCDGELSDYADRLRAEYPGEDLYSDFLRDDILYAYAAYSKTVDLRNELESQGRWAVINFGDKLDRYFGTSRRALLHNFKALEKLEAERREQEAEPSEEDEPEVEVTDSPQNGEDDGFDFDPEEDHVDQDAEYEKAMLEREERLYIPRSFYLDTTVAVTKGDWSACDETSPGDQVGKGVASDCSESSIDEDGKPSPSSTAEPASLAGTTQDLHERTLSNAIDVDGLLPSDVAGALSRTEAQDERAEVADAEAKSETDSLPSDGLIDQADLACLLADYACVLEDGETQTSFADGSESVMVDKVPNSSAEAESQISEIDTAAVAGGPEMSVRVEEPAPPPSAEVYADSQAVAESCGLPDDDLPAGSLTVQ